MNVLLLIALLGAGVAAVARARMDTQRRVTGKWARFFDSGSIRRM